MAAGHSFNRTSAEKALARALRLNGIPFLRNQEIEDFEVDFLIPSLKLIIEVDGFTHLSHSKQQKDTYKEQKLIAKGYAFLRFSNFRIREDLSGCLAEVQAYRKRYHNLITDQPINDGWKNELKKIKPLPDKSPPKTPQTIEDYFLTLDDE